MTAHPLEDKPGAKGDRIRGEARFWTVRLADGEATDADRAAFDAWLRADDLHALAYKDALRLHALAGDLRGKFSIPARAKHAGWARPALAYGAGLAMAAAIALAILLPTTPMPVRPDYASEVAEIERVNLQDGSVITLGADTALEVSFTADERHVRLADGEAYFEVAHDAARPFYVEARGTVVRVVGTEFEVKATGELVRVAVTRGIVDVAEPRRFARLFPGATHRLTAGEEVAIERSALQPIVVTQRPRPPASWRDGFLTYDNTTLAEVVGDANRYSRTTITLSDDRLGALRVTASYPTDRLDQLLASLDEGLPVDLERSATGDVLIVPATGAANGENP